MLRRQPSDTSTEVKTLRCINYDDEQASTTQSNDIINANVALASGKEENFTGRGSKDSGIVCDLQTERRQTGRLRDSIDSNEIDLGEECVESFAATSMDEEYAKLRADLEFCAVSDDAKQAMQATSHRSHPPPSDDDIERLCREQRNASSPLDDLPAHRSNHTICVARDTDATANSAETTPTNADATMTTAMGLSSATNTNVTPTECSGGEPSKSDHNKNDVIFKNIFGATKNAIFRTAQSIIENHEKKHAQKMQNNSCSGSGGSGNSGSTNNSKSDVDAGRSAAAKSPIELVHKKDFFTLKAHSSKQKTTSVSSDDTSTPQPDSEMAKHIPRSMTALTFTAKDKERKVPGMVKCFVRSCKETDVPTTISLPKIENGHNGLLRFFESPIFNIHFAIHYLFYSKEPGVLSFIGNKIFSFKDHDVDLYIPQLILMYIQMDDLAEVLDPYLVHRCRKAADFSLKCSWLLEAYNYTADSFSLRSSYKKPHLMLIRELYPKRDRRALHRQQLHLHDDTLPRDAQSPVKKTHHRSQSDATGLLNAPFTLTTTMKLFQTPVRLCLGDLSTGRAFDNGCSCFESVRGTVNDLLGHKTVCTCGASKLAAQREFMKSLVDIGRDLTPLPSKTEKTSILRMRLNLINKNLPARVWLPLNSDMPHHIVRIKEEKTAVLNSKDKTPYIIYVEVVEVNDIYTSPVIAKMMPSLRHTKSEEHLDSSSDVAAESSDVIKYNAYWQEQHNGISDDNAWLPEDDEITAQYLNMHKSVVDRDTISEMSLDSVDSRDHSECLCFIFHVECILNHFPYVALGGTGPVVFNIGDVRTRHTYNLRNECTKPFFDPKDPSAAALKVSAKVLPYMALINSTKFSDCRNHGMKKNDKFVNRRRTVTYRIGDYFRR